MKLLLKPIIYALIVVCLIIVSIFIYRAHPEVQLAFIIPGLFILIYSVITDDMGIKQHVRSRNLRFSRGR